MISTIQLTYYNLILHTTLHSQYTLTVKQNIYDFMTDFVTLIYFIKRFVPGLKEWLVVRPDC